MAEEQLEEAGAEDTPEIVEEPALPGVEELAAELGWKPKPQWKGNEEDWRDAAEFIRHGQNGPLVRKLAALEKSHEQLLRTAAKTTERMLQEQEAKIIARFEQAVEEDDKRGAADAARELAQVQAERNQPDPLVAEFVERNPWYGKDPDATDYAAVITDRLAKQGKSVSEQLEAAEIAVKKRFSELFEDAKPVRKAPLVASPNTRTANGAPRAKTTADLPRDVRAAGEEMVKMAATKGFKYTIDDYSRTYWSEQGEAA